MRLVQVFLPWLAASILQPVSMGAGTPQGISAPYLGIVPGASNLVSNKPDAVSKAKAAAAATLKQILGAQWGATGNETIQPSSLPVIADTDGNLHVRFQQQINGKSISSASIMMHLRPGGTVYGVNGEFTPEDKVVKVTPQIDCATAVGRALKQVKNPKEATTGNWTTACELGAVKGKDSPATVAFKRTIVWKPDNGKKPAQKAIVYASVLNGDLILFQPRTYGARSLETYNCLNEFVFDPSECVLVSNSSDPISTLDPAINDAHNNAILTYNYLKEMHSRDSFDNQGATLKSLVHVGVDFDNAFFATDPYFLAYGDGDGVRFTYFSRALEVVAHEIAHGITATTSGLEYFDESGALNEGFSDIIGAAVERAKGGKSEVMLWEIGEDLNPVDNTTGFRNMADPQKYKNSDFYFERYRGLEDGVGVHWNSGILHLVFVLMVKGGTHPRGKTDVVVPAIDPDFDTSFQKAVEIVYNANVACMTPWSSFVDARWCMNLLAGSAGPSVNAAWDAVGVRPILELQEGTALTQQALYKGGIQQYIFNSGRGYGLICQSQSNETSSGDADLYARAFTPPEPFPFATMNDCTSRSSLDSNEFCFAIVPSYTPIYLMLQANEAYSNVSLTCETLCTAQGEYCSDVSECCSNSLDGSTPLTCDGTNDWNKKCKKCKSANVVCTRNTECCSQKCNSKTGKCRN